MACSLTLVWLAPTLEEAGVCWKEQGSCNSCTPASSLHSESILARGITSWCMCHSKSLILKPVKAKTSHLDEVLVPCQHLPTCDYFEKGNGAL